MKSNEDTMQCQLFPTLLPRLLGLIVMLRQLEIILSIEATPAVDARPFRLHLLARLGECIRPLIGVLYRQLLHFHRDIRFQLSFRQNTSMRVQSAKRRRGLTGESFSPSGTTNDRIRSFIKMYGAFDCGLNRPVRFGPRPGKLPVPTHDVLSRRSPSQSAP